jgi:hypothetical protein
MGTDVSVFGDEADRLAEILYRKQNVQEILERILAINPDEWNLQVGDEEAAPIYAPGSS